MTSRRQMSLPAPVQPDGGGKIEDACDIVNGNAARAAAMRAAREKKLAKEAEVRDMKTRTVCMGLALILTGAGAVLLCKVFPWWAGPVTLLAACVAYYIAGRP